MRPGSTVYCPAAKRATTALVSTPWVTLTPASAACTTHRRLTDVDPGVGEHLVGQLALVGSGKFGNPWLRRQLANASPATMCARRSAALWLGGPPPSRCWQAVSADWNAGDRALPAEL